MVLVVALDLPRRAIESNGRGSIKIVAGALVAHPGPAVPGAPKRQVGLRIIGAGDPDRSAAGFPLVALGPSLTAGFTGRRNSKGLPHGLPGLSIECCNKAADAEFAAGHADHHLAIRDERRESHIISGRIVLDF